MPQNFQIYRSSAGSGKTYTLALSFIALALKGGRYGFEDYYRKILAITFTNKAASEMKERVLFYLDCLSNKKDVDGILCWLKDNSNLNEDVIFHKAELVYKHILHNYTDLGISTIDKFTYKIVRTFATDLGLSHNFELEMDNNKIIQPSVALLLNRVSASGGDLSSALLNFAIQKAEDGKSSNIERDLEDFAKELFKEDITKYTNGNILSIDACMKVKKDLERDRKQLESKVKDLADRVGVFFKTHSLKKTHFLSGTFYNHFVLKMRSDDDSKWRPTDNLLQNIANNEWYPQSLKKVEKDLVDILKPQLIQFSDELMVILNDYYSVKAVLRNIYVIAVLNELIREIKSFKKENNIEQISEFNKMIHNVVINQPSSFIYERLGERYNHYLIDEFQDTSLLQWQNILPLITDSLDFGKSMLVGDGKQSVYRWRGGEVEQFLKLPNIFKGDELTFKNIWERKLEEHYTVDNLRANYRSRKAIINFNNQFFQHTKSLLSDDLQMIYDKLEQESNQAKEGGYVHIELFGDKSNNFKKLILEKIIAEIEKLTTSNNYSYRNITILCNSRKSVSTVAEYLSKNGIPVISNEGLLLSSSSKVNTVVAILRYLKNNNDDISKALIAEYLWLNYLSNEDLHQIHLEIKSSKGFMEVLKRANIHIKSDLIVQESLYELVEQVIRLFNFEEDIYLSFFLDLVLKYTEKQSSSISNFLDWWGERLDKESIVIPEETNAVQVMTIHKSKGLAFDVVIIPFNWEDRRKTSDIWIDTSMYFNKKLPTALIGTSSQLELSYFKDNYKKEKDMSLLDSLNKLYVAMTRPKERLYIFSKYLPHNLKNYEKKENLNSFLYTYSDKFPIIYGDPEIMCDSKTDFKNTIEIKQRKKLNWKDLISLKHTAKEIWDIEHLDNQRNWGKLLHYVLSKIHYHYQKDIVIDEFYKLGRCTKQEYQRLQKVVTKLLSHHEIHSYFTEKWKVRNEKEILMSNGRTYIPDRLLFSKTTDKIVVIDYKTGKQSKKHESQITEYANALMLMGKKNIDRLLIYTSLEIKVLRL